MYGLYNQCDDEMFLMTIEEVWRYLQDKTPVFQSYSVFTDGQTVKVYESSAGANGKLSEQSINEFFAGFEEEGLIIRPIQNV